MSFLYDIHFIFNWYQFIGFVEFKALLFKHLSEQVSASNYAIILAAIVVVYIK